MADVLKLLQHQFKATEIVFPMHGVIVDVEDLRAALPDLRDDVPIDADEIVWRHECGLFLTVEELVQVVQAHTDWVGTAAMQSLAGDDTVPPSPEMGGEHITMLLKKVEQEGPGGIFDPDQSYERNRIIEKLQEELQALKRKIGI